VGMKPRTLIIGLLISAVLWWLIVWAISLT
jgi:hypothetical protein